MNRLLGTVFVATVTAMAASLFGGGEPEESSGKRFGPYEALTYDASIVRDVKYDADTGDVHLQLFPEHKEKELIVKLSNDYFASYRQWDHGGYELVSPANQGKIPYGWTDWVNTSAPYIEYWMDDEVFLHLKRVD